jgi:hypothetical protein
MYDVALSSKNVNGFRYRLNFLFEAQFDKGVQ